MKKTTRRRSGECVRRLAKETSESRWMSAGHSYSRQLPGVPGGTGTGVADAGTVQVKTALLRP
jgi:hypothetical protein